MAKSAKKTRKLSTNEAVEQLLGRKAAKRLRKIALRYAADRNAVKKDKNRKKKPTQKKS